MSKQCRSLINQLSLKGYDIKPQESKLSSQTNFEYVNIALNFCRKMEDDFKLRKITKQTTINEYIAQHAKKIFPGKKDFVLQKLSFFINMMNFREQSPEIELYAWLCEVNAPYKFIQVHNSIIKMVSLDYREFMDSPNQNLRNFKYPLNRVIDIVGSATDNRSLDIFLELVESDPRCQIGGGIRDKMIPVVIALENAVKSVWHNSAVKNIQEEKESTEMIEADYNDKDFIIRGQRPIESPKKIYNPEDENNSEYSSVNFFEEEDLKKLEEKKQEDERQGLVNIAHKYVFGNHSSHSVTKGPKEDPLANLSEKEILQKEIFLLQENKLEAEQKKKIYKEIFETVLEVFNGVKLSYNQFGLEIGYLESLCSFMLKQKECENDLQFSERIQEIENLEIPRMKKLKLLLGKCFEKGSKDIYVGNKQVYKFAIDKEDYKNDIQRTGSDGQIFDLLSRTPPVLDQKGLKLARSKLKDFQLRDQNPLEKANGFGQKEEDKDFLKNIFIKLKSEFYTDTKNVNLGDLLTKKGNTDKGDDKENKARELVRAEPEFDEALGFNFEVLEEKRKPILEVQNTSDLNKPKKKTRKRSKSRSKSKSKSKIRRNKKVSNPPKKRKG